MPAPTEAAEDRGAPKAADAVDALPSGSSPQRPRSLHRLWSGALSLGLVSATSCGPSTGNNYGAAAAGAAVAVATVGVLRAATGECWARCSKGYVCDRESGLCVEGECYPGCGWGQHCERLSGGLMCVLDPNVSLKPNPATPAPAPTPAPRSTANATTADTPNWTEPPRP